MNPFLFRRIRGPVFLLTFAVTALLAQGHVLGFAQSWPLYLLTAGVLRLLETAIPVAVPAGLGRLPYRRSLTGGIVLLLIGACALLLTTGGLDPERFFDVFSRWWPILLIALGLLLLVERIFDRSYASRAVAAGYVPRRRRSGGLIFLVLLLIAFGLANPGAHLLPHDAWHWGDNHFEWDWDGALNGGEAHENQVTLDEPLAPSATLSIDNARGDVEIAPSSDGCIHVTAHQTVHGSDRDQTRAFSAARPVLTVHGGSAATLTVAGHPRTEVNLEITLPAGVQTEIRTHHGGVTVAGLTGALTVNEDHGNVTLANLGGPVRLQMDHGDLRARALLSDLSIDGHTGDVSVSGIRGRAALRGEFLGDTEIDEAAGPVSFHSSRTNLDIEHLAGSLTLDGEDLRVTDPSGGLTLQTRSKEVEITGLSGPATIEDADSDVALTLAAVAGPITVRDNTGNITLSAPASASFSLSGTTGGEDEITSEFPFAQFSGSGRKTIRGQQGTGGPAIALETEHGDLTLHRASAGPARAERRLHAEGEVPAPVVQ